MLMLGTPDKWTRNNHTNTRTWFNMIKSTHTHNMHATKAAKCITGNIQLTLFMDGSNKIRLRRNFPEKKNIEN